MPSPLPSAACPFADVTEILDEHPGSISRDQRVFLYGYVKAFYEMEMLDSPEMRALVARIGLDAQTMDMLIL